MESKRALILTVGTGNIDELEKSLLTPIEKSIRKGEWNKVVLLPSQITKKYADSLTSRIGSAPIEISPLPRAKQEDDPDACFAHFNNAINDLIREGYESHGIVADFTRGTKAMSAALVLAAARQGVTTMRYITSPERDNRGQVVPGQEVIKEVNPQIALASQRLDTALRFISRGAFGAVLELLPDPANPFAKAAWPEELRSHMAAIRSMAEFYARWDRLDYPDAFRIAETRIKEWNAIKEAFPSWGRYFPVKEMRTWVQQLSVPFASKGHKEKPPVLRKLAADLLANAERRSRDHQYEDAVIRAYRIRELIVQIRLFEHGIDTDDVDEKHPAFIEVMKRLKSSGRTWTRSDKRYKAPREKACMLLSALGDKLGEKLKIDKGFDILSTKSRNNSRLIHGFTSLGDVDSKKLDGEFKKIEQFICEDNPPGAGKNLRLARSINFGCDDT